jgi:hypothetical protein
MLVTSLVVNGRLGGGTGSSVSQFVRAWSGVVPILSPSDLDACNTLFWLGKYTGSVTLINAFFFE